MHISEAAKVSFARLLPSAFTSEDFPEPRTPNLLDTGLSWDHSTKRRLLYTDYEHLLYTDLNCCYQLLCYTLDVCNPQDRPATNGRCIYYRVYCRSCNIQPLSNCFCSDSQILSF